MAKLKSELFPERINRYRLSAFSLTQNRERLKFSVEQFAAIIGWSISYQYKLESGNVSTISQKTFDELSQAFFRMNQAEDISFIVPSVEVHRTVFPNKIYTARKAKGLWLEECASLCGWTLSYQQKLESGRVKTITEETANILIKVLQ